MLVPVCGVVWVWCGMVWYGMICAVQIDTGVASIYCSYHYNRDELEEEQRSTWHAVIPIIRD